MMNSLVSILLLCLIRVSSPLQQEEDPVSLLYEFDPLALENSTPDAENTLTTIGTKLPTMPANTSRFQTVPVNTSRFQTVPANTSRFPTVPANTSRFQTVPVNTSRFQTVPANTTAMPANTSRVQTVPVNASRVQTVPVNASRFQTVPVNASRFQTVPANTTAMPVNTTAMPVSTSELPTVPLVINKLDMTQFNVTTLVGLESLGSVRVFLKTIPLGVPSFQVATTYEPFEGLRITIPEGAWLTPNRRDTTNRQLTVSVFEFPPNLVAPGIIAGPAIDLGPHDQLLARQISIGLPLFSSSPVITNGYSLAPISLTWAQMTEKNGSSLTSTLGTCVAIMQPTWLSPDSSHSDHDLKIIVGTTVGGVFLLSACIFLLIKSYQRVSPDQQPRQGTTISTQEGELVHIHQSSDTSPHGYHPQT